MVWRMTIDDTADGALPSSAVLSLDGSSWLLEVEWGLIGGRVEPTRVSVTSAPSPPDTGVSQPQLRPVTADRLRRLPLGTAIAQLRAAGAAQEFAERRLREGDNELSELLDLRHQAGEGGFGRLWEQTSEAIDAHQQNLEEMTRLHEAAIGPQRGRLRTQHDHELVAAVYRRAYAAGEPVTAAVAEHFHISTSTASKRIMAARQAGLLEGIGRGR